MIKNCRSCGSSKLQDILSLGNLGLSDFVNMNDIQSERHPLDLILCKECSLLQLKETTPPSDLYTNRYGYRSGISNTIKVDLKSIVEQACKRVDLQEHDIVVDIGANDGTLLSNYQGVHRVAFEPVKKFAEEMLKEKRAELVINDYFGATKYNELFQDRAKVITAISMFYDLDDPNAFVQDLANVLDQDGLLIIQQNYLVGMLKQHAFDNIVHEHLEYYSLTSLEKLLHRHGLEVIDVEINDINGGSFRTYVKHMSNLKKMRYMERKMKLDTQWTYMLFALEVQRIKRKLLTFIKKVVADGKTVYTLGASTRGNTLLQYCELDHTLITAAMERNPEKCGKKIGSLGIPIVSEEEARKKKPDYFLVLPWFFKSEVIIREAEYLKAGGHLIIPLPKFEVI